MRIQLGARFCQHVFVPHVRTGEFVFILVLATRLTACFVCRYQIGIYYPFFRGHAHLETKRREPWLFGDEYTPVIREAIRRRYQLMPYLYTLFDAASREGSPVLRPLVSLFLIIVWAIKRLTGN